LYFDKKIPDDSYPPLTPYHDVFDDGINHMLEKKQTIMLATVQLVTKEQSLYKRVRDEKQTHL